MMATQHIAGLGLGDGLGMDAATRRRRRAKLYVKGRHHGRAVRSIRSAAGRFVARSLVILDPDDRPVIVMGSSPSGAVMSLSDAAGPAIALRAGADGAALVLGSGGDADLGLALTATADDGGAIHVVDGQGVVRPIHAEGDDDARAE